MTEYDFTQVIPWIISVFSLIVAAYYYLYAKRFNLSQLASRFNIKFVKNEKTYMLFYDFKGKPPIIKQWTLWLKLNDDRIIKFPPHKHGGEYNVGKGYDFNPFEIVGYNKALDNIKELLLTVDYTDLNESFKFKLCFKYVISEKKFVKRGIGGYHKSGWFNRRKKHCDICESWHKEFKTKGIEQVGGEAPAQTPNGVVEGEESEREQK